MVLRAGLFWRFDAYKKRSSFGSKRQDQLVADRIFRARPFAGDVALVSYNLLWFCKNRIPVRFWNVGGNVRLPSGFSLRL
jgi:hypothetical protein